jgi:hypothetical protein
MKARWMRWAEHVAQIREKRNTYKLVGKPEGRRPLGRQHLGGWIILERIL